MAPLRDILKSGLVSAPALLVPVIIVGGLVGGIVTPTEAGVLACAAAFCVSGVCYRELTWNKLIGSLKSAVHTTVTIWAVIAVSTVFAEILVRNQFTHNLVETVSLISSNPTGVLLLIILFVFILGMVIDTTPLLIMLAKPMHDMAMLVGIDPTHLGVVLVMTALIGTVSPPVSLLLCLNCGIAKIPLSETFRIIWSYLLVMLAVVLICVLAPSVVTWLPNLLYGK
jgi:C4-dicarboxylate transporter DctM subunit